MSHLKTRKRLIFRIAEHVCNKIDGDTQPEDIVGVIDMALPDTYDEAEERFQDCIAIPKGTTPLPRPSMLDDLREALCGEHMTIRGLIEAAATKLKPLKENPHLFAAAPDLLEALEELLTQLGSLENGHLRPYAAECRRAIAKAKGETNVG